MLLFEIPIRSISMDTLLVMSWRLSLNWAFGPTVKTRTSEKIHTKSQECPISVWVYTVFYTTVLLKFSLVYSFFFFSSPCSSVSSAAAIRRVLAMHPSWCFEVSIATAHSQQKEIKKCVIYDMVTFAVWRRLFSVRGKRSPVSALFNNSFIHLPKAFWTTCHLCLLFDLLTIRERVNGLLMRKQRFVAAITQVRTGTKLFHNVPNNKWIKRKMGHCVMQWQQFSVV